MPFPIEYSFPATPLDEADVAFVRAELAALEAAHGLFARRPGLLEGEGVFLTHCSPPGPARDALASVLRVLYLVLYFNERVHAGRLAADATVMWALVCDRPAPLDLVAGTSPELLAASRAAGVALRDASARRGADMTSFAHLLRVNLAAFVWTTERHTTPTTAEEHFETRQETISVIAYLRLWGLLIGLEPADELRFGLHLQRIERLSAQVQALANDLRSVDRDRHEGEPNAVVLTEANGGVEADIIARHDATVRALSDALALARSVGTTASAGFHAYLTFVEVCTRGNNTAMTKLAQRYR